MKRRGQSQRDNRNGAEIEIEMGYREINRDGIKRIERDGAEIDMGQRIERKRWDKERQVRDREYRWSRDRNRDGLQRDRDGIETEIETG